MRLLRLPALVLLFATLGYAPRAAAYSLHATADGRPTHWDRERVVFRLSMTARERLGDEALARAVGMATEAWRGLPGSPDLVLGVGDSAGLEAPDALDGVNGVYVSDEPLDGDHLAETRLTFEPGTGRIVDADVVISGLVDWELMRDGGSGTHYDLGAVLTHEMGHALGLADEPEVANATMFPRFDRGDTRARTPEVDDERGVLAAYRDHPVTPAVGAACSASGGAPSPWPFACALFGLMWTRRRLVCRRQPVRASRRPRP